MSSELTPRLQDRVYLQKKTIKELHAICFLWKLEDFERAFRNLVSKLLSDPGTQDFGAYLDTYYGSKMENFAPFHRLKANINTNMMLESFHKVLKYYELARKTGTVPASCITSGATVYDFL